jgi:hypothetical protein
MPDLHTFTREVVLNTKPGTVFYTEQIDGGPGEFVILRGTGSMCAYLTLPMNHPVVATRFEPNCHGGMTFDAPMLRTRGRRWGWGWDYGHAGDAFLFYPAKAQAFFESIHEKTKLPFSNTGFFPEREWLPLDVWADSSEAMDNLRQAIAAPIRAALVARATRRRPARPPQFNTMVRYRVGIAARRRVPTEKQMLAERRKRWEGLRDMATEFRKGNFTKRRESRRKAPRSD